MTIRLLLALLGTVQGANGLAMLAAPVGWYAATPGVAMTGPFNSHFVRDIGLIFLASGAALMLGARKGRDAAVLAAAGAAWPAMHALLHVYGWITHGFPADPATAVTEAVGVVLAAALGAALAWFRMKREANIEALLPSQHRQAGKELRIRRHLP
jgi:hypothetical protein